MAAAWRLAHPGAAQRTWQTRTRGRWPTLTPRTLSTRTAHLPGRGKGGGGSSEVGPWAVGAADGGDGAARAARRRRCSAGRRPLRRGALQHSSLIVLVVRLPHQLHHLATQGEGGRGEVRGQGRRPGASSVEQRRVGQRQATPHLPPGCSLLLGNTGCRRSCPTEGAAASSGGNEREEGGAGSAAFQQAPASAPGSPQTSRSTRAPPPPPPRCRCLA